MYKLTEHQDLITYVTDGYVSTIPRGHRFWDDYEKWLSDGNTPEPFETEEEHKNRIHYEIGNKLSNLRNITDHAISPLQDAVDLAMSTKEEEDNLVILKRYRAELNRVKKQKGYPEKIVWPKEPECLK